MIRYQSELAERDWENAVQGQDKAPLVTRARKAAALSSDYSSDALINKVVVVVN